HPDRPVTPLPGPLPALLGLVGFAGSVMPVYDLAALLGHPIAERPRWLVLTTGTPPLGLAFHELDGHVQVPAAAIIGESGGQGCVRGVAELPDGARPIADLPACRAAVHHLTGHAHVTTEEAGR
ncbi:MAG: chemotaxis protein CheW, partial [Actinoplanes sp.]